MKITDEAKKLITEALASNNSDCLKISLQQSCCGTSLSFELATLEAGDIPYLIDDISVLMDDQTKARMEAITISEEEGELILEGDAPSCCC